MHSPPAWPRPPHCLPHALLDLPAERDLVTVAGLVLVRQRPGTASGVVFITLEDETGVANIVVWRKLFEKHRRAVIAGRLLRVTGRVQRDGMVVHVVATHIEDISDMLDDLALGREVPAGIPVNDYDGRMDRRGSVGRG